MPLQRLDPRYPAPGASVKGLPDDDWTWGDDDIVSGDGPCELDHNAPGFGAWFTDEQRARGGRKCGWMKRKARKPRDDRVHAKALRNLNRYGHACYQAIADTTYMRRHGKWGTMSKSGIRHIIERDMAIIEANGRISLLRLNSSRWIRNADAGCGGVFPSILAGEGSRPWTVEWAMMAAAWVAGRGGSDERTVASGSMAACRLDDALESGELDRIGDPLPAPTPIQDRHRGLIGDDQDWPDPEWMSDRPSSEWARSPVIATCRERVRRWRRDRTAYLRGSLGLSSPPQDRTPPLAR